MSTPSPPFTAGQINRAGHILANEGSSLSERTEGVRIVSEWRACHDFPLDAIATLLRTQLGTVENDAPVARRLKRTPSIEAKLKREGRMELSRMQDIGGLRVVLTDVARARALEAALKGACAPHEVRPGKDYIAQPKPTGYRCLHMIFRHHSPGNPLADRLQVELQVRSKIQHAWATGVETAGFLLQRMLKSNEGPEEWREFFAMSGSALAIIEGCSPLQVHADLGLAELFSETVAEMRRLRVRERLRLFALGAQSLPANAEPGSYFLLELDTDAARIDLRTYSRDQFASATADYIAAENTHRTNDAMQVVLVSAESMRDLYTAYLNYFLDTEEFVRLLDLIESESGRAVS